MDIVTDPLKIITDDLVLECLVKQGIDKDYVEFWHDYAPHSLGKEYSPYAKFYRDLKSGKKIMAVSGLPKVKPDGVKIEVGWAKQGKKYVSKANLFSAIVAGTKVRVTALSDQPSGAKLNDDVEWQPKLFLNGVEQICGKITLLETDPMNLNYCQNVLEWDYGICKRRIRIIEGRLREKWIFSANPEGEVRIKHNHQGNLKFKLGEYKINDDEELVPAEAFIDYPFEVEASPETFYPDPDPETSSVDAYLYNIDGEDTWDAIHGDTECTADDSTTVHRPLIYGGATENRWWFLGRNIILFDTSGLPDTATVTGVTLSLYGYGKADNLGISPTFNIYSSAPASNDEVVSGDFDSLGTEALATAIAYADFSTAGYNVFTLIDVNGDDFATNADGTYISKTGATKLGFREATYDAADVEPAWSNAYSKLDVYSADIGNTTSDPKLIVTYTVAGLSIPVAMHHYKMMRS